MATILNWEASKTTAGAFESLGGSYRIVPEGKEFVLISANGKTPEGDVWSKRFRTLADAKRFPRIRESRQEVFGHQVKCAFERAAADKQSELCREYPTELAMVSLIVNEYLTGDDCLHGHSARNLNALAARLAVAERL
jgi:hypothetical protein